MSEHTHYHHTNRGGQPEEIHSTYKVYVSVTAFFDEEGRLQPHSLRWEDGKVYTIDKVSDVRPAPAMKAGGQGDRYTIHINGYTTYLFFERSTTISEKTLGRWFVERKRINLPKL